MNVARFFEHWSVTENPFRAEEARHDAVFHRLPEGAAMHPDFEKILGEFDAPSASIVFGEKGAGKTAIRMQLASRIARHNELARGVEPRVLLVAYDDLNPILDRFVSSVDGWDDPLGALKRFRLVDHMDGVLHTAVIDLVDSALGDRRATGAVDLGDRPLRTLRALPQRARRDLLLLQAIYDRPDSAHERTAQLKKRLRVKRDTPTMAWAAASWLGWLIPALLLAVFFWKRAELGEWGAGAALIAFYAATALWALVLLKRFAWDGFVFGRLSKKLGKQLRTLNRTPASFGASLRLLHSADRDPGALPLTGADDQRYAMFVRLQKILEDLGYRGVVVVVDRVDEPTVISGDTDRMKAIVWPMLNNKFLQMTGFGFKLLLPVELRHALFRESTKFFQEARLDKQNLIERLTWTGSMLYDLCNARLLACRRGEADGVSLVDLFEADVTRQDLVDALDQMHQPRDAFKLVYQCIQEHCSNVTDEQEAWRIPRLVLETVRKQQSDRVQQLYRGIRPG